MNIKIFSKKNENRNNLIDEYIILTCIFLNRSSLTFQIKIMAYIAFIATDAHDGCSH